MSRNNIFLGFLSGALIISLGLNVYFIYSLASNGDVDFWRFPDSSSETDGTKDSKNANKDDEGYDEGAPTDSKDTTNSYVFDYKNTGYSDSVPVENSVYILKHQGYDAVYLQKPKESDSYKGYISYNNVRLPIDFDELDSPRRIFTFDGPTVAFIPQYFLDKENGIYSISLNYNKTGTFSDPLFSTYRIDLDTLEAKLVKTFDTSKVTYGGVYNSGSISSIEEGKYYTYKLYVWMAGDGKQQVDAAYLIVNADSGEETYLGKVTSPSVDLDSGTVEFERDGVVDSMDLP